MASTVAVPQSKHVVPKALCIGLGVMWLAAFVFKIFAFDQFVSTIWSFKLVPIKSVVSVIAVLALVAELATGILLLIPRFWSMGLGASITLLTLFLSTTIWKLINHIDAPCTCFGLLFKMSPLISGVFQLALLATCYGAMRLSTKP